MCRSSSPPLARTFDSWSVLLQYVCTPSHADIMALQPVEAYTLSGDDTVSNESEKGAGQGSLLPWWRERVDQPQELLSLILRQAPGSTHERTCLTTLVPHSFDSEELGASSVLQCPQR